MRTHVRIAAALTTVVAALSPATTAQAAPSPAAKEPPAVVHLRAEGAALVNLGDHVYGALRPEPPPSEYVVSEEDGGVRISSRRTGGLVHAPSDEPFTQLRVAQRGEHPPNALWIVENTDGEPVATVTGSGDYTFRLAGTETTIGRHIAEDRSLRPKRIVLRPGDVPPGILQAQVID